jgi:hypothetical protein
VPHWWWGSRKSGGKGGVSVAKRGDGDKAKQVCSSTPLTRNPHAPVHSAADGTADDEADDRERDWLSRLL